MSAVSFSSTVYSSAWDCEMSVTPPRRAQEEEEIKPNVKTVFYELCSKTQKKCLALVCTAYERSQFWYVSAKSIDLCFRFSRCEPEYKITQKISDLFVISLHAKFEDSDGVLMIKVNEREWSFLMLPLQDDTGGWGVSIEAQDKNTLVDDITEGYHLITDSTKAGIRYELIVKRCFVRI